MSSGIVDPHDFGEGHPSSLLPEFNGDDLDDESSESRPRKKIFTFLLFGVAFVALIIGAIAARCLGYEFSGESTSGK